MKTILATLLVLVSFSSFADIDYSKEAMDARCTPGDVVYYAKTAKGNKEVLICKLDTNIVYSFGKIGKEPDLYLKRDLTEIGASGETAIIINGDISYHVGYEDGREVLVVVKGSETLANIALDQRSVYNGIRSELTN